MEKLQPVSAYDLKLEMPEAFCVAKQLYQNLEMEIPHWIEVDQATIDCTNISKQAQQVVNLMTAQLSRIGRRLDLHPLNIMRRGSVWVITDPYF